MWTTQGQQICPFPTILSSWGLDAQQGLFKLTMKFNTIQAMIEIVTLAFDKVNPTIINPVTHMWRVIHASQLLFNVFFEYLKVVEIAMVHVLGYVEDERCFNFVAFLKNRMRNRLNNHLQLVVSMYAQKFSQFTTFLMTIPMKCGLMFNQQMAKADMLKFYW
jgi:hypothetical protein